MSLPKVRGYEIRARLGAGAGGTVYHARDLERGRDVALKLLPRADGHSQLSGEFVALARLRHPNIVTVFDYGTTDDDCDYFTMELVEGPDLLTVARQPGAPIYDLARGILLALSHLHSHNLVHADLKPHNVLIDGATLTSNATEAVRLADFGTALQFDALTDAGMRGSIPYAAPELLSGHLDARSDLYSFGVLLFQLISGELPFSGKSVAEVLNAQRAGTAPDLRENHPEIPGLVAELVASLLDPAPGARPQTADEILNRLAPLTGAPMAPTRSRLVVDLGARLIGRERDLATLVAAWERVEAGHGGTAVIAGEEGIGKTRLLREFALQVQLRGGRVIRARAEIPAGLLPSADSRELQVGDARFARADAITARVHAAAERAPLLIIVDNLEAASEDAVDALAYLARSLADTPVLLCVAARDDGVAGVNNPSLERLTAGEDAPLQRLPPLDQSAVHALLSDAFSAAVADSLFAELHRASGGNPAFAADAVEEMLTSGALYRRSGQWALLDGAEIPAPRGARRACELQWRRLPKEVRATLSTASVLGVSFHMPLYATLVEADPADVVDDLLAAVEGRLLDCDPGTHEYTFRHRELWRIAEQALAKSRRLELHRRAAAIRAESASDASADDAVAVARHYVAIDDAVNGVVWASRAGDALAEERRPFEAIRWYRHAQALARGDQDTARRLTEKLADLHDRVGETSRAIELYEKELTSFAHAPADHVAIGRKLAAARQRRGDHRAAQELLMSCLELCRRHQLTEQEVRCHLAIGEALYYAADYKAGIEHAVAGEFTARANQLDSLAVELMRLRGALETSSGDTASALVHLDEAAALAATAADPLVQARVNAEIGRTAIHAGDYQRAIAALESASETFRAERWLEREASALNNLGAASYFRGEWERARSSWERFRRLCARLEWHTEEITALNNLGLLYRDLGQFSQALTVLDQATAAARRAKHDLMAAMVEGNRGEVLFRRGELVEAGECYRRALAEFERIGAVEDIIENRRRLCELAVATGNPQEALDHAIDIIRDAKDSHARLEEGILHRVAATAERLRGEFASATWFAETAQRIFQELGARYELGRVRMEMAELALATGATDEADKHLAEATEIFTELGARWDLTRVRGLKAKLTPTSPPSQGPAGDSLRMLLELAHATGSLAIDTVLERTLDGALDMTGFDRGFILLLDSEGRPRERMRRSRPGTPSFDRDEAKHSASIVRRVAASRQALALTDSDREEELLEHRSMLSLGLRQVLCAPMLSRGQAIGIVYIDSRRLSAIEHHSTLPMLEAFASLAGQAVENNRLREEIRRKQDLMAILAHEIRNPLSGILGYSSIGLDSSEDERQERTALFERIQRDGERLRRLVDNVLELSRHESGNVDWSFMAIDISTVIRDAVSSFVPACRQQQISLDIDADGVDAIVFGNPDRLTQVLVNLIGNAVKFTPERGSIRITARRETVTSDDPQVPPAAATGVDAWAPFEPTDTGARDFVRVDVTDTGPGMSAEVRSRLFEKFAQGEQRRGRGVGLGLYISREIVARHGGTIWVESTPGEGSTFSVRLPAVDLAPNGGAG